MNRSRCYRCKKKIEFVYDTKSRKYLPVDRGTAKEHVCPESKKPKPAPAPPEPAWLPYKD